jgi:hypothetical protein
MEIRAAELTADHLGRTAKIDPGDLTFLVGRLVSIRHKQVGKAAAPETETRLDLGSHRRSAHQGGLPRHWRG